LLAIAACLAAVVCLFGSEKYARAESTVSKPAAARKAATAGKSTTARKSTAANTGKSATRSKPATAGRAAPVGGFIPLDRGRERATSYWERDGGPIDMENPWRTLHGDGQHDPESDAIKWLQAPVDAMRSLPRAGTGNFVDWVAALKSGVIKPRAEAEEAGQMKLLNTEITLRNTRSMPTVTFSHAVHTELLACSNCHDALFKEKAGATEIRMSEIFKGKACGVCHGTVAFPPDQCFRCHNGPRRQAEE
jgi:c(7)-type cytochrome triheme protein